MGAGRKAGRDERRSSGRVVLLFIGVVVLAAIAASCVPGRGGPPDDEAGDEPTGSTAVAAPADDLPPLEMVYDTTAIYCDGNERQLGHIRGAAPGETLRFASAQPVDVGDGIADAQGHYWLTWSCQPNEARLRWELVATGATSGRAVAIVFGGSDVDPSAQPTLAVELAGPEIICDGASRTIGVLRGATPGEQVRFASTQTGNLRPGRADGLGDLELRWDCTFDQAGTAWDVVATGTDSGLTGTFTITGVAPDQEAAPQPTVELTEDPFVCDGGSRSFAVLRNFTPGEVIDFSSPDADSLIDASADGTGSLPIRWQCSPDDAGATWELTATGVSSGRSITLTITGAGPDPAPGVPLEVTVTEEPFACDGESRVFATIANLTPGELVDFSSPQAQALRQGQAGEDGTLPIRWQCGAGDIDKIWELTATGQTSEKSTTLTITGASP